MDFKSTTDYYVFGNTLTAYAAAQNQGKPCAPNTATCIYIDPSPTPTGEGHNYYNNRTPYHLKSKAAFGEVYYEFSDVLKLTAGLRYTHDRKTQVNLPVVLFVPGSGHPVGKTLPPGDWKEMTGRLVLDWKPEVSFTDSTLVYASFAKGYKGGGLNPPQSTGVGKVNDTFDPEFVNSFEIGTKNTLLDGSLVFNATAFYYDYKGYQVSKIVNRTSVNENIDAKISGLEIESIWEPIHHLRFNANLGLLKTEIVDSKSIDTANRTQGDPNLILVKASNASNCVASKADVVGLLTAINANPVPYNFGYALLGVCTSVKAPPANATVGGTSLLATGMNAFNQYIADGVEQNLKGKELPNSPKATISVGAQYTWNLPNGWDATLRGDYYHQGKTYSRIYNTFADRINAWENVNATLQVVNPGMGIQVEAYVKNLLDDEPLTDIYLTDDSSGLFQNGFILEPRTYGISIQKSF